MQYENCNCNCHLQAQGEVKALNTFFTLMATEPARAFYGLKHVQMANEHLAIESLLLSDSLFRSTDLQMRKKYVDLVDSVKEQVRAYFIHEDLKRWPIIHLCIIGLTGKSNFYKFMAEKLNIS